MKEKLELMLMIYREKLKKINTEPIDYAEGLRCEAIIGVLENLYYYVIHEENN